MVPKPLILVAGLGRCGTSLVLQMLAAGGLTIAGAAAMYEDRDGFAPDFTPPESWLDRWDAVKVLHPHLVRMPRRPLVVVWLDRAPREQAASQVKWLRAMGDPLTARDDVVSLFQRQLAVDREAAIESLYGLDRMEMNFEHILAAPLEAATFLSEYAAEYGIELDPRVMMEAVRPRDPSCASDLEVTPQRRGGFHYGNVG